MIYQFSWTSETVYGINQEIVCNQAWIRYTMWLILGISVTVCSRDTRAATDRRNPDDDNMLQNKELPSVTKLTNPVCFTDFRCAS